MKLIAYIVLFALVISCKNETKTNVGHDNSAKNNTIQSEQLDEIKLASGRIQRIQNFPSDFITERTVDIWLPDHYSEDQKFAVLYMHDGQMLFDSTTTWNKQEWKVDEWASKLMEEGKTKDFIIVAIHNISEIRWLDYFPQKTLTYLSDGEKQAIKKNNLNGDQDAQFSADNYLEFLTQELKPHIDSNYSVLSNQDNTFIAGSSMGGLIAMYAVCEYANIFGGAACISTHWPGAQPREDNPITKAFFEYMQKNLPKHGKHLWYFDYGTETLDAYYPQYADEVDKIFAEKGYDDTNFRNIKFEGADHSENSWNKRLDVPFMFLLDKKNK